MGSYSSLHSNQTTLSRTTPVAKKFSYEDLTSRLKVTEKNLHHSQRFGAGNDKQLQLVIKNHCGTTKVFLNPKKI